MRVKLGEAAEKGDTKACVYLIKVKKKKEPLRGTALINKLSIVFISSLPMSPLSAAAPRSTSGGELPETSGVAVFPPRGHQPGKILQSLK